MKQKAVIIGQFMVSACLISPALSQTAPAPSTAAGTTTGASDNGTRLEEVVVTAQRQSQSLQKVPIAVSAVTSGELAARGITDTTALSETVPNLNTTQNGTALSLYLRGVGSNAADPNDEASVATYVDGVYIASPIANIFKFNNIERIEVLKGPQGTLFGRNATGGVIQVVTKDPSQTPGGEIQASYGNYNTVGANFYGTTGLAPNLAADLAVVYNNNLEGYGRDIYRNVQIFKREDADARTKIFWTPNDTTQVRLSADYELVRSDGTPYQLAPGVVGADGVSTYPGPYKTQTNLPGVGNNDIWGVSGRVDHDFGDVRFVSISAYRHITGLYDLDEDTTPAPIVNTYIHQRANNFSQELQLLSAKSSPIQWVVGAYYFDATYGYEPITLGGLAAEAEFGGAPAANIYGIQHTHSYSVYGQATAPLPYDTKLTGGLRYTYEEQDDHAYVTIGSATVVAPPDQHQNFSKPTWRIALDHQFTQDVLGYISYNRGIKSGGYNLIGPGAPGYKPEILDAYEVGLKSEFLQHTVRVNVAGFYYKYADIQVQNIAAGAINTVNAAAAEIKGVDADVKFVPLQNLTISSSFGYVYGVYTNFKNATFYSPQGVVTPGDASGQDIINTPRYTANGSLDYRIPAQVGVFLFDFTAAYRSTAFLGADNRLSIPGYAVFNSTLGWTSINDRYGVQLWVRNLLDKQYYASRTESTIGDIQYLAAPRTFGVTLSSKF